MSEQEDVNRMIRKLDRTEMENSLYLVWDVFCKYEAINYPESGKQAFWKAIHSEEYLDMLSAYGTLYRKPYIFCTYCTL